MHSPTTTCLFPQSLFELYHHLRDTIIILNGPGHCRVCAAGSAQVGH